MNEIRVTASQFHLHGVPETLVKNLRLWPVPSGVHWATRSVVGFLCFQLWASPGPHFLSVARLMVSTEH